MESGKGRESGYIRKVQEDTRRYVQGLLKENETLRSLLAKMEAERLAMEEELLTIRENLDRYRRDQITLQRQLVEIQEEKQRFSTQYAEIEQQNSNLSNLYVASYQLHGTMDREEVLNTIQEILINLVGSEEIGIFELHSDRSELLLVSSIGVDVARYRSIPSGSGSIGGVAQTGEAYYSSLSDTNNPEGVTACIPLKIDGKVTGVITVFRLLPQKTGLEALDHELFDLLGTQAATAIYCTSLHEKLKAGIEETQ